jgi:integrase/recombinase XerC/integrase/recombinase XerD
VQAAIEEYLDDLRAQGRSVETCKQYRWHLGQWSAWCQQQDLDGWPDRAVLRRWAAGIRDRWSPATARTAVVTVKGFLRWAGAEGMCAADLGEVLKTPKKHKRVQRSAKVDEVTALLAQCGDNPAGVRNAAMISLTFDSLLRVSELCGLRLRDLDLERMAVVVMGKGGKQEIVRFGEETARRLRLWLAVRKEWAKSDALFVGVGGSSPGATMTRGGVRCILGKLADRAGVPALSPHALRRGGAVAMIEAGAPSRVVQFHGRWDDLSMVEWYTQQVDAAKVFDRYSPVNGAKNGTRLNAEPDA